jgi:GrpB-like predicted nucleotidyltransferase (UPF0157 family)
MLEVESRSWEQQFEGARDQLVRALGVVPEGGIIEGSAHIGATSLPGFPATNGVEIGLAVWPFPLEDEAKALLTGLGYTMLDAADAAEQHFCRASDDVCLRLTEPGSILWSEWLLLRDYLRQDGEARERLAGLAATAPDVLDPGTSEIARQTLIAGEQWWVRHHGFGPVMSVAQEMQGFGCDWYISSGWALDLFLGQVSRLHHDVDVVVARTDQLALQEHLTGRGWKLVTPFNKRLELWPPHMYLKMPRHQVHAHRDGEFIDILLTDFSNGIWHYRRNPIIMRARERMALTSEAGIPFLAPELVLLFKSQNTSGKDRSKDQRDFEQTWQKLEPERRAWLRWALVATDPEHAWLERMM